VDQPEAGFKAGSDQADELFEGIGHYTSLYLGSNKSTKLGSLSRLLTSLTKYHLP
jgi:hypothetical protein